MSLLDTPSADGASSPAAALAFLWSGRWLIAFVALLAVGLGVAYAEHRGTIWRARSVVYVERSPSVLPIANPLPSRNYAHTQAAMLRSLPILMAALERPELTSNPVFADAEAPVPWLKKHLDVSVGEADELITVSVDSPHLERACELVNGIVDTYLGFHAKAKTATASEVLSHLTEELARRETDLNAIQLEQMEFLRKHPGIGLENDVGSVATERFRELSAALTLAESAMIEAEANRGAALPADEAANVVALRQRRLELLAEVTPEHPAIVQLDEVIADLERRSVGSSEQGRELEYAIARQRYESLAAKVREQEARIVADYPIQAEYRILQMRVERARNVADALAERVRVASISAMELNAAIYERATPAGAAIASSKTAIVAVLATLGLLFGAALAWLRSLMARHVKTVGDAAALLRVAVAVPGFRPDRRSVLNSWRKAPQFAEAMRSVRTVLCLGGGRGRGQVLQVTSPSGRHGKSLVAAGLGIAMAQAGERTLVLDAGFGPSAQTSLFGGHVDVGLAQVLGRTALLESAIAETGITGLHFLPAGTHPAGAPALLDSPRFAALLRELQSRYDRIVIDSPALSPNADARVLATVADAVLLVLRSGKSTRSEVRDALDVIAAVGGRVAGAVVNRAPRGVGSAVGRSPEAAVHTSSPAARGRTERERPGTKELAPSPAAVEPPEAFG